jgi:hypothetical protein
MLFPLASDDLHGNEAVHAWLPDRQVSLATGLWLPAFDAVTQAVEIDDRTATFIVVKPVCQIIGFVANRNVVGRMKQQQDRVDSFRRFPREQMPIELIRQ